MCRGNNYSETVIFLIKFPDFSLTRKREPISHVFCDLQLGLGVCVCEADTVDGGHLKRGCLWWCDLWHAGFQGFLRGGGGVNHISHLSALYVSYRQQQTLIQWWLNDGSVSQTVDQCCTDIWSTTGFSLPTRNRNETLPMLVNYFYRRQI